MPPSAEWVELLEGLSRQGGLALLTFARLLGGFAFLPAFAAQAFPAQVRSAVPIAMLPLVALGVPITPQSAPALDWTLLPQASLEFIIGAAISLPACALFWAARGAGELVDIQTGANNQEVFTATTHGNDGPAAQLFVQLALLGFLTSGGLHELAKSLWTSFAALGPGASGGLVPEQLPRVAEQIVAMVAALAVKVAMPLLALFLLVELGLAVASRAMQHLPLSAVAGALKSMLLPLALLVVLQAFSDYLLTPAMPLDVLQVFRSPTGR